MRAMIRFAKPAGSFSSEICTRSSRGCRKLDPARDRDVLTLCVWEGLDYASAAVALDIPIGTVRSRLARARSRLRAAVDDDSRKEKGR